VDAAAYLRAARGTRRVSQRELAELAGVPRSTLDRIEAGITDPRLRTLERLFTALGYDLAVCNDAGRVLRIDETRERLRTAGRHFPPHWEYEEVHWYDDWWGWYRKRRTTATPTHTYWYRHPAIGFTAWEDAT
jgi:transcriptional regulator with XRE-family HTH domain